MENFTQNLKKYLKPNAVIKFEKIEKLQKKQQVLEDHIFKVLDLKDLIKGIKHLEKECDTKIAKLSKEIVDIEFILERIDEGKLLVRQRMTWKEMGAQ